MMFLVATIVVAVQPPTGTPTTRANSSKVGDNLVKIWQDGVGQISLQLLNNLTIMLKIIGNKLGK